MRLRPTAVRALEALRENERLLGIGVATFLVMSGQGVVAPVLPLFARDFGASAAAVGLTLSIFALARLILNVPLGILADRRGRRGLLVAGPLVTALGMAGSGIAGGIGELLAWRALAGAGSAMYMTAAQIYLVDISSPRNRSRVIGLNQAALLAGVSIGPGVGGLLADGFGYRVPFYAVGAAGAAAALWAWRRLPETRPHPAPGGSSRTERAAERRALLRSPSFLAICAVSASIFFSRAGGRFTIFPLRAAEEFGWTVASLGGLFTLLAVINLVGVAPASWLADRFGRRFAIVPSGIVVAAALAVLGGTGDAGIYLAAAIGLACGTALLGPAPAAYAADVAPPSMRGLAMGLYRSAGDLGFVVGPALLGRIADASSLATAFLANAGLVALVTLVFACVGREAHREEAGR